MTFSDKIRLLENKDNRIDSNLNLTDEQKEEVKAFFHKHPDQERNIPDNMWMAKTKEKQPTYQDFKNVMDAFNNKVSKSKANRIANKKGISGIEEGKDYLDLGEHELSTLGKFHAYVPFTWLGAKTIAGPAVNPHPEKKDSASWCIGDSSTKDYWNNYFYKYTTRFLIICGDNIPTKKVCISIHENYNPKYPDTTTFYYDTAFCAKTLTVWDYFDNPHYISYLSEGIRSNKELDNVDIKEAIKEFNNSLLALINIAKEKSDGIIVKQKEEYSQPIVVLKSNYIDSLVSYRASDEYKESLSYALSLFKYLDTIVNKLEKVSPTVRYSYIANIDDSCDYLTNWYNSNRDLLFRDANDKPEFLEEITDKLNTLTKRHLICMGKVAGHLTGLITFIRRGDLHSIVTPYNKFIYIEESLNSLKNTPIGERKVIINFDRWGYLTTTDIVAFFGQEMLSSSEGSEFEFKIDFNGEDTMDDVSSFFSNLAQLFNDGRAITKGYVIVSSEEDIKHRWLIVDKLNGLNREKVESLITRLSHIKNSNFSFEFFIDYGDYYNEYTKSYELSITIPSRFNLNIDSNKQLLDDSIDIFTTVLKKVNNGNEALSNIRNYYSQKGTTN